MFKKKRKENKEKSNLKPLQVVAPVQGELIDLSEVKDQVFSSRMMGEGFAIVPNQETILSPVAGKAVNVFPTGHALGFHTKEGVDVLVHVGLDTVSLNGQGFEVLIKEGEEVVCGQPIVRFDSKILEKHALDPTTMVIFTEGFKQAIKVRRRQVEAGDVLIGA